MKIAGFKLVWRVFEKNKGPFKSFQKRPWPAAYKNSRDGDLVFQLIPLEGDGSYYASIAETTDLQVRVMDRRGELPVWCRLTGRYRGVTEAKAAAERFLISHPEYAGN